MDEAKVILRVCPDVGDVVYVKAEIGRNEGGLDRRKVNADDFRGGELIGKVAGDGVRSDRKLCLMRTLGEAHIAQIPV